MCVHSSSRCKIILFKVLAFVGSFLMPAFVLANYVYYLQLGYSQMRELQTAKGGGSHETRAKYFQVRYTITFALIPDCNSLLEIHLGNPKDPVPRQGPPPHLLPVPREQRRRPELQHDRLHRVHRRRVRPPRPQDSAGKGRHGKDRRLLRAELWPRPARQRRRRAAQGAQRDRGPGSGQGRGHPLLHLLFAAHDPQRARQIHLPMQGPESHHDGEGRLHLFRDFFYFRKR